MYFNDKEICLDDLPKPNQVSSWKLEGFFLLKISLQTSYSNIVGEVTNLINVENKQHGQCLQICYAHLE